MRPILPAAVALSVALCACGSASNSPDSSGAQGVSVQVEPRSATIGVGQQQGLQAVVTGGTNLAVSWSIQEAGNVGTVSTSGVYTAPSVAGAFHVVATSVADPTKSGAAVVNVSSGGGVYALPADRATLWRPGVTYNGGITNRTTVCASIASTGGNQASQIQSAIDACPAGQVVLLTSAAQYNLESPLYILKSGITLRGQGAGKTILRLNNSALGSVVVVGYNGGSLPWETGHSEHWRPLAADAVKDAYSVLLQNASGLLVGEVVAVDENLDYASSDCAGSQPNGTGLTWYQCNQQAGWPLTSTSFDYASWGEGRYSTTLTPTVADARPLGQAMQIASLGGAQCTGSANANCVTFTTPFHMRWRVSHAAHVARWSFGNGTLPANLVQNVGVESMTLANPGQGDGGEGVGFHGAANSWAKNIEVTPFQCSAVRFNMSVRCELRDSYIHHSLNPNPGGDGYGIAVDTYAADNLIENNIVVDVNKVSVFRSSGGGNVYAYNLAQDDWGSGYPTQPEVGMNESHMATSQHELFEGNESHSFGTDARWGNAIYATVFRNHLTCLRAAYSSLPITDQVGRRCMDLSEYHSWFSFVGNVLGCDAVNTCANAGDATCKCNHTQLNVSMPGGMTGQTGYAYEYTNQSGNLVSVWSLGTSAPYKAAQTTLLRDGNFDWFTGTQKWHGVGGNGTPANGPPSTLPSSLYLTSKPAFFGANPWPWVDPTTGTTYVLPARRRMDAGTPNVVP